MQNYLNFPEIWSGAFFTNHMAQKCNTLCNKTTFVWVQFKIYFHELAKHYIQMLKKFLPTFVVHIEIIDEYLHELTSQIFKNL